MKTNLSSKFKLGYLKYDQCSEKDANDIREEILQMRYYSKMSFKEISENTGVSINTALGRMRYGLINLRKKKKKHKISLIN